MEEDEIDDLFSFDVSTPTTAPQGSGSNFDDDDDLVFPPTPVGSGTIPSISDEDDLDDILGLTSSTSAPPLQAPPKAYNNDASANAADVMADLFDDDDTPSENTAAEMISTKDDPNELPMSSNAAFESDGEIIEKSRDDNKDFSMDIASSNSPASSETGTESSYVQVSKGEGVITEHNTSIDVDDLLDGGTGTAKTLDSDRNLNVIVAAASAENGDSVLQEERSVEDSSTATAATAAAVEMGASVSGALDEKETMSTDKNGSTISIASSVQELQESEQNKSIPAPAPPPQHPVEDDHDAGTRDFLEWLDVSEQAPQAAAGTTNDAAMDDSNLDDVLDSASSAVLVGIGGDQKSSNNSSPTRNSILSHHTTSITPNIGIDDDDDFDFAKEILGEKVEEADSINFSAPPFEPAASAPLPTNTASISDALPSTLKDEKMSEKKLEDSKLESTTITNPSPPAPPPRPPSPPPVMVEFDTLSDAVRSPLSTIDQIRDLCYDSNYKITSTDRSCLWTKIICGRTLEDVHSSSLADSYVDWCELPLQQNQPISIKQDTTHEGESTHEGGDCDDELCSDANCSNAWDEQWNARVGKKAETLALVFHFFDKEQKNNECCQEKSAVASADLALLMKFYYQSSKQTSSFQDDDDKDETIFNALLSITSTLLYGASMWPNTRSCSVLMMNVIPRFMPLFALTPDERQDAARFMHRKFYILACYHIPLLVLHLDRYVPGWHWPKLPTSTSNTLPTVASSASLKIGAEEDISSATAAAAADQNIKSATEIGRNPQAQGLIPITWFISNFVGDITVSGDSSSGHATAGAKSSHLILLPLWDWLLAANDSSLKFFLALSVLVHHSESLLLRRDDELQSVLEKVFTIESMDEELRRGDDDNTTSNNNNADDNEAKLYQYVSKWRESSQDILESTPQSVVAELRRAEDEAVNDALLQRQRIAEKRLRSKLDAESKAHHETQKAAREKEDNKLRDALTRKRLVSYYTTYNSDKVDSVDKILVLYEGRLDVLDSKLKRKYGVGFRPLLPMSQISEGGKKLFNTVNMGMQKNTRMFFSNRNIPSKELTVEEEQMLMKMQENAEAKSQDVAVKVSAEEVLPLVYANKITGPASSQPINGSMIPPLKYYLVDSRPTKRAQAQGRFPTAVVVCPESLLEPDSIQKDMDLFESLRGAVHICIMGEGLSSIQSLYGHVLSDADKEIAMEDESRTGLCALFFIKKGFPFVSIIDGGFAAAHSWLYRIGPLNSLHTTNILVDYDENVSEWAKLENTVRNETIVSKEERKVGSGNGGGVNVQELLDNSLASLMIGRYKLEHSTLNLSSKGTREVKESTQRLFLKPNSLKVSLGVDYASDSPDGEEDRREHIYSRNTLIGDAAGRFNPFSSLGNKGTSLEQGGSFGEDGTKHDESTSKTKEDNNRFKNAFQGLGKMIPREVQAKVETKDIVGEKKNNGDDNPKFTNPFAGLKGLVPKEHGIDNEIVTDKNKVNEEKPQNSKNRFAGLMRGGGLPKPDQTDSKTPSRGQSNIGAGLKNRLAGFGQSIAKVHVADSFSPESKTSVSEHEKENMEGASKNSDGEPKVEKKKLFAGFANMVSANAERKGFISGEAGDSKPEIDTKIMQLNPFKAKLSSTENIEEGSKVTSSPLPSEKSKREAFRNLFGRPENSSPDADGKEKGSISNSPLLKINRLSGVAQKSTQFVKSVSSKVSEVNQNARIVSRMENLTSKLQGIRPGSPLHDEEDLIEDEICFVDIGEEKESSESATEQLVVIDSPPDQVNPDTMGVRKEDVDNNIEQSCIKDETSVV